MHQSWPYIDLASFLLCTSHASILFAFVCFWLPSKWAPCSSPVQWLVPAQTQRLPSSLWSLCLSQLPSRNSLYLRSFSALKVFNVIIYKTVYVYNFIILTPDFKDFKEAPNFFYKSLSNIYVLHLGLRALPAFPGFFPPSFHASNSPNKAFGCLIPLWHPFSIINFCFVYFEALILSIHIFDYFFFLMNDTFI